MGTVETSVVLYTLYVSNLLSQYWCLLKKKPPTSLMNIFPLCKFSKKKMFMPAGNLCVCKLSRF